MPEPRVPTRTAPSIAVVGVACRFPDADDAAALLDAVLTGRRAFRRIPPNRLDLAEYYQSDPATSDATNSTRAALIEGWQFDRASFGIDTSVYRASDPAHWLALETAGRALAAAGLPAGAGLDRDRTGVIIGNTLAGDTSRANALRVRWPYVRRALTDALQAAAVHEPQAGAVLSWAERRFLAPFPPIGPGSLAGSMPATIAATISAYFGFRGGSHAVDSASSSSLQAITTACAALACGDLDAVVAGGVDLSLDPLELIGLAKAGVLATADVRIYDQRPSGYLPGEGCGVVILLRAADARAAGLQVAAEILGWGTSSGGVPGQPRSQASSLLLAMRRAYDRAGVDPADIDYIEGNGAATLADDEAELSALASIRAGSSRPAALGSVKANIGHAKAAAGAAGLIKTVLAVSTGVVPPTTGVDRAHSLITGGDARVLLPLTPRDWAAGPRLAAVSTSGFGGSNVHLVLRHEPAGRSRGYRSRPVAEQRDGAARPPSGAPEPKPFLLHARDRASLAATLSRLADRARWLSDGELVDLACALGRSPSEQGPARVALVAARQEQLAARAQEALGVLSQLTGGRIATRPGIFASDGADGRLLLLLSGEEPVGAAMGLRAAVGHCLDMMRWLDTLEVAATGAVGHGFGLLAGLAWAGALGEREVLEIAELRAQFVQTAAASGADPTLVDWPPVNGKDATRLRTAIAKRFRFGQPRRRLISTVTGAEVTSVDEAVDLICAGFAGTDRAAQAVADGAAGVALLLDTGPGQALGEAAARVRVPAVSLQPGFADQANAARVAAALFAAGALGDSQPLFAGQHARPIDIWREPVFITSPCETAPRRRLSTTVTNRLPTDDAVPTAPIAAEIALPPPRTPAAERSATEALRVAIAAVARADVAAAGADGTASHASEARPEPDEGTTASRPAREPSAAASLSRPAAPAAASDGSVPASLPRPAAPTAASHGYVPAGQPRPAAPAAASHGYVPASQPRPAVEPAARDGYVSPTVGVAASRAALGLAGVASWSRCFTESLRLAPRLAAAEPNRAWRVYAAASSPRLADLGSQFTADPAARQTLAVLEHPADEQSCSTALAAARDAVRTGELVVVTTSAGFTGFFATLHAENPLVGITVLRVPPEATSLAEILPVASAAPGQFRELVIAADGMVSEPVLAEVPLPGGADFPLGPDDVIVVSRATAGAGLVLARVAACSGTGIVMVGRAGERDDTELIAGLEELRSAGARIGYEIIDIGEEASVAAAMRRIEGRLGPVTAIAHAASSVDPVPITELSDDTVRDQTNLQAGVLEALAASIPDGRLKLILSFGTVAGRYGLPGQGLHALGCGALASAAGAVAARTGCEALHLDLPAWSTRRLGEHPRVAAQLEAANIPALDVNVAGRLLLKTLTTPGLPRRLALHGRIDGLASRRPAMITTRELGAAGLPRGGRFLREVAVYYPGIELACTARLSLASDPFLADYPIDGRPALPPVLALEALAQAASVLAGQPIRQTSDVAFGTPVVLPNSGEVTVRICAQRTGETITVALRSSASSYRTDHARAVFRCERTEGPDATVPTSSPPRLTAAATGLVDGTELYGPVCFQSGRFRRIALLPEVTARSGRAIARGDDDEPWFALSGGLSDTGLLLGSPGLNDAALQLLQACVPHRRVRVTGCESVQFGGRAESGPVEIRAVAEPVRVAVTSQLRPAAWASGVAGPARTVPGQPGAPDAERADRGDHDDAARGRLSVPASREAPANPHAKARHASKRRTVGRPGRAILPAAASPAEPIGPAARPHSVTRSGSPGRPDREHLWSVEAVNASGELIASWRGVRLRDAGPLPRNAAWPPALLAAFLEHSAADLGLDDGLRITVSYGPSADPAVAMPRRPRPGPSEPDSDLPAALAQPQPRLVDRPGVRSRAGAGPLAGFTFAVRAPVAAACAWVAIDEAGRQHQPASGLAIAYGQLSAELTEPPPLLAGRVEAIRACLATAGAPAGTDLRVIQAAENGWVVLATRRARIACTVVELSGVAAPVAIALLTLRARHARPAPTRATAAVVS